MNYFFTVKYLFHLKKEPNIFPKIIGKRDLYSALIPSNFVGKKKKSTSETSDQCHPRYVCQNIDVM
jgi:hypothetical protein